MSAVILIFLVLPNTLTAKQEDDKSLSQGQLKKAENQKDIGIYKQTEAPGQTVDRENNGLGGIKKTGNENLNITIGKNQEKKLKTAKLGTLQMKDLLNIAGTDAGKLKNMNKKLYKLELKQATGSSLLKKRRAVMGIITSISGNIITLAHQIQSDRIYTIVMDGNTVITGKLTEPVTEDTDAENATSSGTQLALEPDTRIAAFGLPQADGTLLAEKIHIIPGLAVGVYNLNEDSQISSTPSSITATPETISIFPTEAVTPTEVTANPT